MVGQLGGVGLGTFSVKLLQRLGDAGVEPPRRVVESSSRRVSRIKAWVNW